MANLYFRRFLLAWEKFGYMDRLGAFIVNYADDLVICCKPGSLVFLQNETTLEPQKPANFKREANISCRCGDCKELIDFLKSPTQSVYRFKVRKERRAHLHRIIDSKGCDVNHVTERIGSPQTLVCTKTTGSYQRLLNQYLEDKDNLVVLRSLEMQLSSKWAKARH